MGRHGQPVDGGFGREARGGERRGRLLHRPARNRQAAQQQEAAAVQDLFLDTRLELARQHRQREVRRLDVGNVGVAGDQLPGRTLDLGDLGPCELVIEAAPERLELKHELYAKLSEIVSERCVLATNTSSLLVTAIAAGAKHPERVVGMHFFNPAPLMALVEVVAGEQSSPRALAVADATGVAMGKTVIHASDGPIFPRPKKFWVGYRAHP